IGSKPGEKNKTSRASARRGSSGPTRPMSPRPRRTLRSRSNTPEMNKSEISIAEPIIARVDCAIGSFRLRGGVMVTALLRDIGIDKFTDVLNHSPKQTREMIFDRLGIKKKPVSSTKFVKPGEKNAERTRALFDRLQSDDD